MKNIRISQLVLENFKCHRHLVLPFEGRSASVYGDNATGKTSIYDALTWLLFGKDSAGNGEKNIDIKPLDTAGNVRDRNAITSVEAELLVDGVSTTFKRTYREVWSTKRGSSEETYDGNTSEYYVDGVPCKKYVFDQRISEIVPEDLFRLLTSVELFSRDLSWQKRRGVLFDMAGTLTDREIMATNERFAPLLEGMGKLSLEDYRRKLASEKRGFVGAKTEIPARISECQKTVEDLEGLDFAAAKAELESLNAQRNSLSAQLVTLDHDSALEAARLAIREAKLERDKLDAENEAFRRSQTAHIVSAEPLRRQHLAMQTRLSHSLTILENLRASLPGYDQRVEGYRGRYGAICGETFSGGTCPTCGQQMPMEQLMKATEAFEKQKAQRLADIAAAAEQTKQEKAAAESRIESLEKEISAQQEDIAQLEEQITAVEAVHVVVSDMADYASRKEPIDQRICQLTAELEAMQSNAGAVRESLRADLAAVNGMISKQQSICGKESALRYAQERIKSLLEDAREAARCLEAIEKMLYLADEYTRYKTRFVEDSVNNLFRIARFRLFREQANGGVEERCDVVYDGVPYTGLNNGAKINVGIDIINTLSRHYGVCVPLFVDNAESVTRLENADTQVIRLAVSEIDKELRCEYEN